MSKTRIYKSGHTYNLHGCQQSPRFINRINKVCQRINKLCQRIAQNVDTVDLSWAVLTTVQIVGMTRFVDSIFRHDKLY